MRHRIVAYQNPMRRGRCKRDRKGPYYLSMLAQDSETLGSRMFFQCLHTAEFETRIQHLFG